MKRGGRKGSSEAEDVNSQDLGVPKPQMRRRGRWRDEGPAVLHTGRTGGRHLPVVDDVFQCASGEEAVVSKDEATPQYRGSQEAEEEAHGTQGGSAQTMARSASRIKVLDESSAKVSEEKNLALSTLNQYKVAKTPYETSWRKRS